MLGMSGILPLESASGHPSLWTAQTAKTFSKLAKDTLVRYRTFSESYICQQHIPPLKASWQLSPSAPWECLLLRKTRRKASVGRAAWLLALTSAKTGVTKISWDYREQASHHANKRYQTQRPYFVKQRKTAVWQSDANDSILRALQSNGQEGEGRETESN